MGCAGSTDQTVSVYHTGGSRHPPGSYYAPANMNPRGYPLGGTSGVPASGGNVYPLYVPPPPPPSMAAVSPPSTPATPTSQFRSGVTVNSVELNQSEYQMLLTVCRGILLPGNYWYDAKCGSWGYLGGPSMGIIAPNLPFRGTMSPNCSNGNTGVFINGRQLHIVDTTALLSMTGYPCVPGRYWVDAASNCGLEGVPIPMFNIAALMMQRHGHSNGAKYGPNDTFTRPDMYSHLKDL